MNRKEIIQQMENDLISVIVPIYNGEMYLEKCIDSIRLQTYKNIEILLVNDGSTDRSIDICNNYTKMDSRIKLINKEKNSGLPDTRNVGILHANGKFICFIDCDDSMDPTMLEDLYSCIMKENVDVVRCKMNFLTTTSKVYKEDLYELNNKKFDKEQIKEILYHFITRKDNIGSYVMPLLIRTDKLVKFNPNLKFMEDSEFWVRLLLNIDSVFFCDKLLYQYRYNEFSMSKNYKNVMKNVLGATEAMACMKESLRQKNLLTENLEKDMNNHYINIVFAMVKLFKKSNMKEAAQYLNDAFEIKDVQDARDNLDKKSLKFMRKFEIFLVKNKAYYILALLIKLAEK